MSQPVGHSCQHTEQPSARVPLLKTLIDVIDSNLHSIALLISMTAMGANCVEDDGYACWATPKERDSRDMNRLLPSFLLRFCFYLCVLPAYVSRANALMLPRAREPVSAG